MPACLSTVPIFLTALQESLDADLLPNQNYLVTESIDLLSL